MTREEAIKIIKDAKNCTIHYPLTQALDMAIKALEQEPIDKSTMMYEIYMQGVNMAGEYQGCWVRFKDIEKIVDKYIAESDEQNLKMKQYSMGNVLDKIRAEIKHMDFDFGDFYDHTDQIIEKVCEVIDKYRKESED